MHLTSARCLTFFLFSCALITASALLPSMMTNTKAATIQTNVATATTTARASTKPTAAVRSVTPGKTFAQILESEGFTPSEANKLISSRVIPTKMHLIPNERYLTIRQPTTGRLEVRIYLDIGDAALCFWKLDNHIGVDKKDVAFEIKTRVVAGKIAGSLIESIKKIIPDDWVAFRFEDAYYWDHHLLKKLYKNDRFSFVLEEKYDHGQFVKYGEILSAELHTRGEDLTRVLWRHDGANVFVDLNNQFSDRLFYAPVDYVHVTSLFTKRRFHPVRHNYQPHLGVDLEMPEGSPVYAPRDGIVKDITHHRANGNLLVIAHDAGLITSYNHLKAFAPGLHIGMPVKAGQVIGFVGCTGYCTSPHLHFAVRRGDYLYDPIALTKPYPFSERDYWETEQFKKLTYRFEGAGRAISSVTDPQIAHGAVAN